MPNTWLLTALHATLLVSPQHLDAIAQVESGWNAALVSRSGCVGIYQIMPRYARSDRASLRDPTLGRLEAARQLAAWYRASGRGRHASWFRATAAYNCGWGGLRGTCGTGYARRVYLVWRNSRR